MIEEWRVIKDFPDYVVSNYGRVMKFKRKYIMKQTLNSKGYSYARPNGHKIFIHKLVMEAFYGPRPVGLEINHLDMDKTNNRLSNLEYCTRKDNAKHAIKNGRGGYFKKGKNHIRAKLRDEDILRIRALVSNGHSKSSVGRIFNVKCSAIYNIIKGRTWNWLQ